MPQIYVIRATEAPVAIAIAHQGDWFHLARWDLKIGKLERGAWLRGRIYQRRCDISPDGKFFYYFAMKNGRPFHAVSRVPWLTALALWHDNTTYSRGWHFEPIGKRSSVREESVEAPGWKHVVSVLDAAPDQGSVAPLADKYRLRLVANGVQPYGAERRRGWAPHSQAPSRPADDVWHERTPQWLWRERPGGGQRLELRDGGYARGRLEGRIPRYALDAEPLADAVWADWDARGRLLVATRGGTVEIRSSTNKVTQSASLAHWVPDPAPSPGHARRW